MPKKTRIRQTKEKKSSLKSMKQSQDVKQSVRVVVNLKDKRARRRPARKTATPFRGEPLALPFARFTSAPPTIISGNISDDQRKAIMAEGAKQLALETQQQNKDRAAIENTRDVPALKYGGTMSESNFSTAGSIASSLERVKAMNERLTARAMGIPSVPPSLRTVPKEPAEQAAEQDTSGFKKRKNTAAKIAVELEKVKNGQLNKLRTPKTLIKNGWDDDEIELLDKEIEEYFARNPVFTMNKTLQRRFKNIRTGGVSIAPLKEDANESDGGEVSGYITPSQAYKTGLGRLDFTASDTD